ncbi:MAG: N-acetylmuramoyl-L-alanine amidase [Spirochaetales bacterium]|nr:N-acetylmuramoyl-L-alanine amidase [Spirochaetales bacterium]
MSVRGTMVRSLPPLLLVLLALLATGAEPIWGGGLELHSLLAEVKGTLQWEPLTETGHIVLSGTGFGDKGDRVLFQVGSPWLIVNFRDMINTGPILRESGALVFPENTLAALSAYFGERSRRASLHRVAAILIDPGHGGKDSGAIGTYSVGKQELRLQEKDVVLDVSLRLYELLKAEYPDKRIELTREDDTYLKLEERTELANGIELKEQEAIIFVSVHANAAFNRKAKGYEVWVLPSDYRRTLIDPQALGEENRAIAPILNVLLEEEYSIESVTLARSVLGGFDELVGSFSPNRGIREESWFVVRKAMMPSILIELGYVTNQEEARLLGDPSYLQKLAQGIYTGIRRFVTSFESTKGFTE